MPLMDVGQLRRVMSFRVQSGRENSTTQLGKILEFLYLVIYQLFA